MNPIEIIEKYYDTNSKLYEILIKHSKQVTKKALEIARNVPELNPNLEFIEEAAMLHDIGIIKTNFASIQCFGKEPYIKHGILGAEILMNQGLKKHALVAQRHTGLGITKEDIVNQKIPLPVKDYVPESVEEEIICLADKFFSKAPEDLDKELSILEIKKRHSKYGEKVLERFENLCKKYKLF